ncbi:hypothetical protein [uncultured Pseudoalteromonas sp.]|uniref:hypothetical protein n=1 Tax=uncultured Pseudoalteromonas sp. TaxID=114053 RepID=UPI002633B4B9|nr:hypothetical protein [uncultured Pseudoalteromonas sp.]
MKKLVTLPLLLGLAACARTQPPVTYDLISLPALNTQETAYLGERMLMKTFGHYANCIDVSGANGVQSVIKNTRFCQKSPTSSTYYSSDLQAVGHKNGYGNVISHANSVTYDAQKNEVCASVFSCYDSSEMSISYKKGELVMEDNALQQIIEYNGRTGSVLNFTYREFAGGMARSAFTTDFKMDLEEGNEIGYKGARLEIKEATNKKIIYSVLKSFN